MESKPRKKKRLPVAVYDEEFVELIKATKKKKHKVAFLLGYAAGLRISEVVNLEKRDFDLERKSILVREGKGGKDRTVPLPKGFRNSHLKQIPMNVVVRTLQRAFKRAAEKSGLLEKKPTASFHSLRHGFGTQLVEQSVPIHHIRTLMGHSNISTTNTYLQANPKGALKSYEEFF